MGQVGGIWNLQIERELHISLLTEVLRLLNLRHRDKIRILFKRLHTSILVLLLLQCILMLPNFGTSQLINQWILIQLKVQNLVQVLRLSLQFQDIKALTECIIISCFNFIIFQLYRLLEDKQGLEMHILVKFQLPEGMPDRLANLDKYLVKFLLTPYLAIMVRLLPTQNMLLPELLFQLLKYLF